MRTSWVSLLDIRDFYPTMSGIQSISKSATVYLLLLSFHLSRFFFFFLQIWNLKDKQSAAVFQIFKGLDSLSGGQRRCYHLLHRNVPHIMEVVLGLWAQEVHLSVIGLHSGPLENRQHSYGQGTPLLEKGNLWVAMGPWISCFTSQMVRNYLESEVVGQVYC